MNSGQLKRIAVVLNNLTPHDQQFVFISFPRGSLNVDEMECVANASNKEIGLILSDLLRRANQEEETK